MSFFKSLFGRAGGPGPGADRTESILREHLDGDFVVFPLAETATAPAQLEAIGKAHGVRYPAEYVAHVCGTFPGLHLEVKEAIWRRPKVFDVGPFWTFLYGLNTYTSAPESEEWMRLDAAASRFRQDTGLAAAPILAVINDPDVYCALPDGTLAASPRDQRARARGAGFLAAVRAGSGRAEGTQAGQAVRRRAGRRVSVSSSTRRPARPRPCLAPHRGACPRRAAPRSPGAAPRPAR